ncbi:hypothetical protein LXL04_038953 [Taraxacum kok-saghyz]
MSLLNCVLDSPVYSDPICEILVFVLFTLQSKTSSILSHLPHIPIQLHQKFPLEPIISIAREGLKAGTKKQKYDKISEKKMLTPIEVLCKSYPSECTQYFHYCRSLRFEDKPDYSYLKRLFRELFIREDACKVAIEPWTISRESRKNPRWAFFFVLFFEWQKNPNQFRLVEVLTKESSQGEAKDWELNSYKKEEEKTYSRKDLEK